MNLPNKLTMARVIMIPFFVIFMLTGWGGEASKWISLAIFIVASLTDLLDGHIARKHNLVTNFGKFMDPLADKLSLVTLLGLFVSDGQIPLWVLAIILVKEVTMVIGGGVALQRGVVVYALRSGMVPSGVFVLSIIARFLALTQIADTLLWISVALSMVALIWYAVDLMKKLGIKADSTK